MTHYALNEGRVLSTRLLPFLLTVLVSVIGLGIHAVANAEDGSEVYQVRLIQPKVIAPTATVAPKPSGLKPGNPYVSFLPQGTVGDYEEWAARLQVGAKLRREQQDREALSQGISTTALLAVGEAEGVGVQGLNDIPANAEFIGGFGTGAGDDGEADISGNLQTGISARAITLGGEPDGSITTASDSGVASNDAVIAPGVIGDGLYGSAALPVTSTDISVEPNGTPLTAVDTGLTPRNGIIEADVIGDGAYGSAGTGEGDFDFYKVRVDGIQFISVTVSQAAGEFNLRPTIALYRPDNSFAFAVDDISTPGSTFFIVELQSTNADWYIAVGGNKNFDGNPDDEFPTDPTDPTTGPGFGTEGSYEIAIDYMMPGDFDVIEFQATAGDRVSIEVDTDGLPLNEQGLLDPILAIFDSAGNFVLDDFGQPLFNDDDPDIGVGDEPFDSRIDHTFAATGTYYAYVGGFNRFPTATDSFPTDRFDPSTGPRTGAEGPYEVTISRILQDVDFYSFDLEAGDIFGANLDGGGLFAGLFAPDQSLLIGTAFDTGGAYPFSSPLPLGGNASVAYIANEAGTYSMAVLAGSDAYGLELRAFRPPNEGTGPTQIVFLDFDGASVDSGVFGSGNGVVSLSPLSSFLANWGLAPGDEAAVTAAIVSTVENEISQQIKALGLSDNFDIDIRNSFDDPDVWGDPNVSRVVIGGTQAELGISTIGIAESIDVGNFDLTQDSVVLLDLLSNPSVLDPNSLNSFGIDASSSKIDLVGHGVGTVVAHEMGHYFANWHTSRISPDPNIMDEGGDLAGTLGIGPDGIYGSGDDIDVDFGVDVYSAFEAFIGIEDSLNTIAFGLSTVPPSALPIVVALPDINGDTVEDLAVIREGSVVAEVRSGTNGALLDNIAFFTQFAATPIAAAALPDADGDGIAELAVLAARDSDGRVVVEMRNLSGPQAERRIFFAADHTALALAVVDDDADNNGIPEIAVLLKRNSDGRGLAEVKNAFGTKNNQAIWAANGYDVMDVEVVDDADNNGVPEIAIMSMRDSDNRIVVQTKNAVGTANPQSIFFMAGNTAIDLVAVSDKEANGVAEIAVLSSRDSDGRNVVEIKNAFGAKLPVARWFSAGHTALGAEAVADGDGNGVPEVAVLSTRDSDGRILVEVKNAAGTVQPKQVFYSPGYTAHNFAIVDDADNNGVPEAAVLMVRDSDGRILVQGRNTSGPAAPKNFFFSP